MCVKMGTCAVGKNRPLNPCVGETPGEKRGEKRKEPAVLVEEFMLQPVQHHYRHQGSKKTEAKLPDY